jgi:5-carboxymethyl-2-hydroxymuconate isomerase
MPHITIDFTANIATEIDQSNLVKTLQAAAHGMKIFPSNGIRTFARKQDHYAVGLDTGSEAFIQIHVRVSPDRTEELKKDIARTLFQAAETAMAQYFNERELAIQLEVSAFTGALTLRRNTINKE